LQQQKRDPGIIKKVTVRVSLTRVWWMKEMMNLV
jgi:hypothetical protein